MKPLIHYNPVSRLLRSRVFVSAALVILVLVSLATVKEIRKKHSVEREITALRDEIEALESQNTELSGLLNYLQTDQYAEKEGRIKLGLAKPGEKLVVVARDTTEETQILDENQSSVESPDSEITDEENESSNLQRWWRYFFDRQLLATF